MAAAEDCLFVHTSAHNTESIRHALLIGIGKRTIKGFFEKKLTDTDAEWKQYGSKMCYFEPAAATPTEDKKDALKMHHQMPILRHIGRLTGLYPKNEPEKALVIDEVLDLCISFRKSFNGILDPKESDKVLCDTMQFIDALIQDNFKTAGQKYIIGTSITIADLELASVVGWLGQPKFTERGCFDKDAFSQEFVNVRALRKIVNDHPYLVDATSRHQAHYALVKAGQAVHGEAHTSAYIASAMKGAKRV
eukprot:GEMP01038989.1.p1 GENE.GEMP01038989.1~~GEMP01038989.1.p1  ORF type:complete len:280 (+),score=46.09 GEMP01038989.1:94-840(+)